MQTPQSSTVVRPAGAPQVRPLPMGRMQGVVRMGSPFLPRVLSPLSQTIGEHDVSEVAHESTGKMSPVLSDPIRRWVTGNLPVAVHQELL